MQKLTAEFQYIRSLASSLRNLVSCINKGPDACLERYKVPIENYIQILPNFWSFIWEILIPSQVLDNHSYAVNEDGRIDDGFYLVMVSLFSTNARLHAKIKLSPTLWAPLRY